MRRPLIAGNAKMHQDESSLKELLEALRREVEDNPPSAEVLYCPAFTLLHTARTALQGSPIAWGGQDMYWEGSGAYTGEVSAAMLKSVGCRYVIIGHSERRTLFGETDAHVQKKTAAALDAGLVPIVCIGETLEQREAGDTKTVLSRQVAEGLSGLKPGAAESLVLAYEPVWAIGTGKTATPDMAQEAHTHIRACLGKALGASLALGIRILYGGSVKAGNAAELLGQADIDGALVGGASLTAEAFIPIVRAAGSS